MDELATAKKIKHDINTPSDAPAPLEHRMWFISPSPGHVRHITYKDMAAVSDKEYQDWRTVDFDIPHHCDLEPKLKEYLSNTPDDVLAARLATVPSGSIKSDFTPWQRYSLLFYSCLPFSITSTIHMDTQRLREIVGYTENDRHKRKQPMQAQKCMLAGSFPDVGIIDTPTGCWKTGIAICLGYMATRQEIFEGMTQTERYKGLVLNGGPSLRVARLVIIATSASTFRHFVDTLGDFLPVFKNMDPNVTFHMWTTSPSNPCVDHQHSVANAEQLGPNHVVFWIVPVSNLNNILRSDPDVAVAICITDEYIETPREKTQTQKSEVLKQIITQATPQTLVKSTRGASSWLRMYMEGPLHPPKDIHRLVRNRQFNDAQLACSQACKLDLLTLMHPLRSFIRNDLEHLVPRGLVVHFVKSKRVTLASTIQESHVDMAPASLVNVIIHALRSIDPTPASVAEFRFKMDGVGVITPSQIISNINGISSRRGDLSPSVLAVRTRLVERITEFANKCPICFSEHPTGVNVYGCCGYCVCDDCFSATCQSGRCPFCRTSAPAFLPRSQLCMQAPEEAPPAAADEYYPLPFPVRMQDTLSCVLSRHAHSRNLQVTNLTNALHGLVRFGHRRILLVIELNMYSHETVEEHVDHRRLSQVTGIEFNRIDNLLSGRGSRFAALKERFDTDSPEPQGMVSYGVQERFLVGTNLDYADCLVAVGNVPGALLTQAVGRIFRPRASRDNTVPMTIVKISTN